MSTTLSTGFAVLCFFLSFLALHDREMTTVCGLLTRTIHTDFGLYRTMNNFGTFFGLALIPSLLLSFMSYVDSQSCLAISASYSTLSFPAM